MIIRCDHDAHAPRLPIEDVLRRAERANVRVRKVVDRVSPSGAGWHREVTIEPMPGSAMEVVALQLLFGSDPLREAYCVQRARVVDRGVLPPFWKRQSSWDVLYVRAGALPAAVTVYL